MAVSPGCAARVGYATGADAASCSKPPTASAGACGRTSATAFCWTAADPNWTERDYDGVVAYAETKRAQVVLAELWAEELREIPVVVNAMHPGWADTPAVRSSLPRFHRITQSILRTPAEGADTVVWLAASPAARQLDEEDAKRRIFDRAQAIPLIERACALAPANPGNRLLLALTLLDLAPERRAEALDLLREVEALTPRPSMRIEDLAMRREARARLAAERVEEGT